MYRFRVRAADDLPPLDPSTPTVSAIRAHVEQTQQHPVNNVLVRLYRRGADYVSEHSDKAVDVVRGSRIVNLLLGARRTMTLRMKDVACAGEHASLDGEGEGAARGCGV